MQVHATDPAYVASDDSHARFRAAALVSVMFVAALAFVHVISWALGLDLQRFGVHPRDVAGLAGHRRRAAAAWRRGASRVERAPVADRGHGAAVSVSRFVAHRVAGGVPRPRNRRVAVRPRLDSHRRERTRVRHRRVRLRRRHPAPRPARVGGVDSRRVLLRGDGVGRAADQARACRGKRTSRRRRSASSSRSPCAAATFRRASVYSWEVETEPAEEQGEELTSAADSPRAAG